MKIARLSGRTITAATLAALTTAALTAGSAPPPASAQVTGDPVAECRHELDDRQVLNGVCFWEGPDFTGVLYVETNPTLECAPAPASVHSAVNLTPSHRFLYAAPGCSDLLARLQTNDMRTFPAVIHSWI